MKTRGDIVQAVGPTIPCRYLNSSGDASSSQWTAVRSMAGAGYKDGIVMAAGTFVQGSSIELSCDAPRRSPYCAYLQGGLSYEHIRYTAVQILNMINEQRL